MTSTSTFAARRACLVALVPLALAVGAGTAAAEPVVSTATNATDATATDIATNPNAQDSNPIHNGAALGAGLGAAFGVLQGLTGFVFIPITVPLEAAIDGVAGASVGALVGVFAPDAVPQVLP